MWWTAQELTVTSWFDRSIFIFLSKRGNQWPEKLASLVFPRSCASLHAMMQLLLRSYHHQFSCNCTCPTYCQDAVTASRSSMYLMKRLKCCWSVHGSECKMKTVKRLAYPMNGNRRNTRIIYSLMFCVDKRIISRIETKLCVPGQKPHENSRYDNDSGSAWIK